MAESVTTKLTILGAITSIKNSVKVTTDLRTFINVVIFLNFCLNKDFFGMVCSFGDLTLTLEIFKDRICTYISVLI